MTALVRYQAAEAELHEAAVTYADYPEPGERHRDVLLLAAVAYAHAVAELVPGLSFTEQEADRNARGGS